MDALKKILYVYAALVLIGTFLNAADPYYIFDGFDALHLVMWGGVAYYIRQK